MKELLMRLLKYAAIMAAVLVFVVGVGAYVGLVATCFKLGLGLGYFP